MNRPNLVLVAFSVPDQFVNSLSMGGKHKTRMVLISLQCLLPSGSEQHEVLLVGGI